MFFTREARCHDNRKCHSTNLTPNPFNHLSPTPVHNFSTTAYPITKVAVGAPVRIGPVTGGVVLHPVVTVMVCVGITQVVVHVGQGIFLVMVAVGVLGQQSVLWKKSCKSMFMSKGARDDSRARHGSGRHLDVHRAHDGLVGALGLDAGCWGRGLADRHPPDTKGGCVAYPA